MHACVVSRSLSALLVFRPKFWARLPCCVHQAADQSSLFIFYGGALPPLRQRSSFCRWICVSGAGSRRVRLTSFPETFRADALPTRWSPLLTLLKKMIFALGESSGVLETALFLKTRKKKKTEPALLRAIFVSTMSQSARASAKHKALPPPVFFFLTLINTADFTAFGGGKDRIQLHDW